MSLNHVSSEWCDEFSAKPPFPGLRRFTISRFVLGDIL